MIIIKPEWVSHADRTQDTRNKKPCIYSVHVHPDGKRLATGSLDGTVKIWNTIPIFDEQAEKDPNCHKLLCTMTMHNGAVLCVRWSNGEGRYLASSSDNDNVIIIWERDRNAMAGSVFGSSEVNHESWRAVKYLRGHDSDVQDLAWSKDNQYLASCGVDGFVIVWDGSTFEQVKKIDQHGGFVKGVTWDPAGKFLASQSDDKMVKVWRTSDWGLEKDITSPFINAPGTTLFRRLSWAPDGVHVAAANAVNGIQCIAAIINRDDWNADVSLVGHTLPIEVTCFNPKMFYIKDDSDESDKSLATICALGSQDRSVSIWATKFSRPVCVAADIFDNNVYDIAWTPDGKNLFACSQDGTVACLQLGDELHDEASEDAIYTELSKYGYGRAKTQLPETPTQLELEEEITNVPSSSKRIVELMEGNIEPSSMDIVMSEPPPKNITSSSSALPTITEQKISIAKNGKKRIQPVMLSSSSSSSSATTTTSTASTAAAAADAGKNNSTYVSQHTTASVHKRPTANIRQSTDIEYDDPIIPSSGIGCNVTGNKRKLNDDQSEITGNKLNRIRPEWIDVAVAPPVLQKSQVTLGLPKVQSVLQMKSRPDDPTVVMECHNAPSSHSQSSLVKTKIVTSKQGTVLWTDYLPSAVLLMTGNQLFSSVSCEDGSIYIYTPAGRRFLPPILLESTPVILQCSSQWLLCLTSTGLLYTWDVIQFKCNLHGISIAPLLQVALLDSDKSHKAPSIQDIRIQKNGLPILITSLQQAFVYHCDMKVWLRISDAWYIISEFWGSGVGASENPTQNPLGWLSSRMTISNSVDPTTKLIMDLAKADESTTGTITMSHIETQLAVAALLESPLEYKDWLMYYAKKLSDENAKVKVDELCRWLLGPPYTKTEFTNWQPTIMGLSKKDLLKQILPVLAQNRQLQRTVTEYKSCI